MPKQEARSLNQDDLPIMSVLTLLLVATLQSPADKAIESAVAAYAGIRTAKATFEQTITNPLLGSELKSTR